MRSATAGPTCKFTGPDSGAAAGLCTGTQGYISNSEINGILNNDSITSTTSLDEDSYSNIMIWDETNWVAYMDDDNKAERVSNFQGLNFGGTTD